MFYVYVHTVPNGKIYVGATKDPVKRWGNGEGYISNKAFYDDIKNYGWKNIKHEIVASYDNNQDALKLEAVLIALLHSEHPDRGYNQTTIYDDAIKKFASRIPATGIMFEKQELNELSFFEVSDLPRSACEELIEQWIFNKEHKDILKSRLLDGISYSELAKLYNKSERQMKRIVREDCRKLEDHML